MTANNGNQKVVSCREAKTKTNPRTSSKMNVSPKWRTSLKASDIHNNIVAAIQIQDATAGIQP